MREYAINPLTWYGAREVGYTPRHFTIAKEPLTSESKQWISETLIGRYSIVRYIEPVDNNSYLNIINSSLYLFGHVAFEDPREAVLYELRWA
jgi:hypothetical protein